MRKILHSILEFLQEDSSIFRLINYKGGVNMLTSIVGINWGDEGKGRVVDKEAENYDIVVRYQGGNNAGHTVENEKGKFILNLLPSGITREGVVNVMGNGMVIDIEHLAGEMQKLKDKGIEITPENLKISDRAIICMPYHVQQDCLEEERLGAEKYGSTRKGIAPVYSDKYAKKGIRIGDLLDYNTLEKKLQKIVNWKTLTAEKVYGAEPISFDGNFEWLKKYGEIIKPYITDTTKYLEEAIKKNKDILFEAQLGALRDIEFGIWPFTTSSHTIAAYATAGAGIPGHKLDKTIGIMKAYSTCVGGGPFTVEMFGDNAEVLRTVGNEYGATTGRPRRVGPFDIPASKYGIMIQGADEIALTKLDVLSYMDEIPVCVAYDIDGKLTTDFPIGDALNRAKPIIEYLPGFKQDISHIRKMEDLPQEAKDYIKFIAQQTGANIKYISVSPEREAYIEVGNRIKKIDRHMQKQYSGPYSFC